MSASISIENTGPIEEFQYTPEQFGVHVLRGKQQAGKTTILRSIELVTTGRTDEKPTKRDGSKSGKVEAFGKTLKIGRTIREEGELSIDGLGELDLSVLHTPKFKDAETRDKYRVATLVRMAQVNADPSLFYDVVGGEEAFKEVVGDALDGVTDLVDMASKVKRAIDKEALALEKSAIQEKANCEALTKAAEGVDPNAEVDPAKLQAELRDAMQVQAQLTAERKSGLQSQQAVDAARKAIEEHGFIDVVEATTNRDVAISKHGKIFDQIGELQKQLKVQADLIESYDAEIEKADAHNLKLKSHQAVLNAQGDITIPSESDIAAADERVAKANAAIEYAAKVRIANDAAAKLQAHRDAATALEKKAAKLRSKAQDAMGVLSTVVGAIPNCPFRIQTDDDGVTRLVVSGRKENEFFDELSDGAKWTTIIPLTCNKPGKAIVLSQAAWGEIQPANKRLIHELFEKAQCYLFVAQVDDGELRCEWFGAEESQPR